LTRAAICSPLLCSSYKSTRIMDYWESRFLTGSSYPWKNEFLLSDIEVLVLFKSSKKA